MLYIVTEDKNSARDFWKRVADTFIGVENYVLEPLPIGGGGNTRLQEQITSVFTKISKGDILFVAFDNIANTKNFVPSDFIVKTAARCKQAGVVFKHTTYYCFEELYLSYDELVKMSCSYKDTDIINFVSRSINNTVDYYVDPIVQDYIKQNADINLSNREHLLNYLLVEASKNIKGYFKITKSGQCFDQNAECWVKDCIQIQKGMSQQQVNNVCTKQCRYCCKGKMTRDKLMDLNNKSIFARRGGYQIYELDR